MKKPNIKLLISIGIIIIFSLGVTYAFMNLTTSSNTATGEGGCFQVEYTGGQAINNLTLASSTNYLEGENTELTLSKSADCQIYTEANIVIYTNTETTAPLANGALKYIVLQGSTTVSSGEITKTGDQTLATVTLTSTATTYQVYLWVDSDISQGTFDDKTYSGYIYANSTQTSTIK